MLAAAVMALDGFDVVAMALAAPHVMPRFGLSPSQMGVVFSTFLVGLGLGSMFLGSLGDRYGRRRTMLAGTALLAVTTFGTALSSGFTGFAFWRFASGLCLGLCLTNATALVAELAHPSRRAATVALISTGMSGGVILAGLVSPLLVTRGGWQLIFIVPSVAAALIAAGIALWLPETRQLSADSARQGVPLSRLLRKPLRAPLLHFAFLFGLSAAAMYWYTNWLPVVLPKAGFTTAAAAHQLSLAQTVSLPAGVLIGWLVDRGRSRLAFSVCYAIVIGALLLFSQLPQSMWLLLVLFVGGGIVGAHSAIVPLATRNFPSDTLASAIGVGVAMTRIGAIGGSMIGGLLLEQGVSGAAFFAALTLPILGCLALVWVRVPGSNG